jgi:MFS family permease
VAGEPPVTSQAPVLSRAPLAGRYAPAVAIALLGLCPFIVLTTATTLFTQRLVHDLSTSMYAVQLSAGLSNAGYAFGAVAAADLTKRFSQRRIYVTCEVTFVAASLLAALAPGIVAFSVGRIIQGATTGMLLVVALPPLVTNHGVDKLPLSAAFVNLGLFGMVTLGPVVGGLVGSFSGWRLLFVSIGALGFAGIAVGLLGFEGNEPPSRGIGFDFSAIPVAFAGTFLPFAAVSWLSRGSFTSPGFLVPLVFGLAAIVALVLRQYHKDEALMPVKMIAHTLPVTGIGAAMLAGAGFTALLELAEAYLLMSRGVQPAVIGGLLACQLLGVAVAAWLFKIMLNTRWLPVLAFSGLFVVAVGGAVLLALPAASFPVLAVGALLLGFGAGAGVAPGLFMGGLSVPSNQLGPTFALVELLRSEAAFLVGPVLLHVAMIAGSAGLSIAIEIMIALLVFTLIAVVAVLLLGGAAPHAPDLAGWLSGESSAFHSPRVLEAVRGD